MCKASAQHFLAPHHRTVRLTQAVPPPAFAAHFGPGSDPQPFRELTLFQKERLLALVASSGVLENVATLIERMELPFRWKVYGLHQADACAAAARNRHMHIVRFLMAHGYPLDVAATTKAVVQHCDMADMQWLLGQEALKGSPLLRGELTEALLQAAASSTVPNATAKLEWLLSRDWRLHGQELPKSSLLWQIAKAAADGDNLQGLQLALGQTDRVTVGMRHFLLDMAACNSALCVTAWLLDQPGTAAAADRAAEDVIERGHTGAAGVLRLLLPRALEKMQTREGREGFLQACFESARDEGQTDAALLISEVAGAHGHAEAAAVDTKLAVKLLEGIAASGGSMEEARRLWERYVGPEDAEDAMDALRIAVRACNMPMLEFLVDEADVPWENDASPVGWRYLQAAVASSAEGEDVVAMLQWLHERGCPMDGDGTLPVLDALSGGKVAVLEWIQSNILDPEELTEPGMALPLACAVRGGCEAAVEWLLDVGGPMGQDSEAYLAAAKNGDLDMLRCLKRLGVPWGPDTVLRAVKEYVPAHVVRWMVGEGGAPCDGRAAEAAPEGSELQAVLRAAAAGKEAGPAASSKSASAGLRDAKGE